jgi:hypothetical protein
LPYSLCCDGTAKSREEVRMIGPVLPRERREEQRQRANGDGMTPVRRWLWGNGAATAAEMRVEGWAPKCTEALAKHPGSKRRAERRYILTPY